MSVEIRPILFGERLGAASAGGRRRRILDNFYYQKTLPMHFTPWGGRTDRSISLDNLFGPDGLNNPSKITSPELTKLLDEARTESDTDRRAELLQGGIDVDRWTTRG